MKSVIILYNSFAIVTGIFGIIKAVPKIIKDENDGIYLIVISIILIIHSLIGIYSSFYEHGTLLFVYSLCIFLSLFLLPLFWNSKLIPTSSTIIPFVLLIIVIIIMALSISLSIKIRSIRSEYRTNLDR